MMSLWDALRMNMMISYQELVRTFPFVGFPHLPISVIMSHPCDNDDNYKIAAISNQGSG